MVLHQTQALQRFLATLTKLSRSWLLAGPKNPNFDPAVTMGWNQRHCEDDQILGPTAIHGSKLELEQPRYHENWANALIDAPLTSRSHNFWSGHWIFNFHTFLETRSHDIFGGVKINSIQEHLWVAASKNASGYNQIKMAPKDITRITFTTEWGSYCYTMMPFWLKSMDATYQTMAIALLRDMMHDVVEVYVVDMIVKSKERVDQGV